MKLTQHEFVLMKDMRASGWTTTDAAIELRHKEKELWIAYQFDTWFEYMRLRKQLMTHVLTSGRNKVDGFFIRVYLKGYEPR